MVIINFQIEDKVDKLKFFWKAFLVANTKFEINFEIFFLKINNADILFSEKTLI